MKEAGFVDVQLKTLRLDFSLSQFDGLDFRDEMLHAPRHQPLRIYAKRAAICLAPGSKQESAYALSSLAANRPVSCVSRYPPGFKYR